MKSTILKSALFLLLLLLANGVRAISPEAEYKKLTESWTLRADGSQEYRYYMELTLYTHTAMNGTYGETFIRYNPQYQELKINDSYTRQKDGTLIKTPDNAFVEVLPQNAANAPDYNHLKEMVIVHTGLELGATIYLDYSIVSKPGYLPEIDICQELLKTSPVREYSLTFSVPENKTLNYDLIGLKNKPVLSANSGNKQVRWTLRNLPASSRAPQVSLQNEDIPGLLVTTYPSVKNALQILYRQMNAKNDATCKVLAEKLTQNCHNDYEKLKAILNYVHSELDNCPLTLAETAYRIRPAEKVYTTVYGTNTEKINLLNGLLNLSGIPAEIGAAYYLNADADHCGLSAIRELLVITEINGKHYLLNPQHNHRAAQNCNFIIRLKDGSQYVPENPAAEIQYKAHIVLSPRKVNTELTSAFSHYYIPYTDEYSRQLLSNVLISDTKVENEKVILTGKQTHALNNNNGYILVALPESNVGISKNGYEKYNSKREVNLLLPGKINEEYVYTLEVPSEMQLCTPLQKKKIDNAVGTLEISIQSEGSQVKVVRAIKLKKQRITPSEYADFRKLMTEWADQQGKQLLFAAK